MNTPHIDPEQLEQRIGALLRTLPAQLAPPSLERHVLQELARRAARPWWLQGFGRWPVLARLLFAPVSLGFVKLAFMAVALIGAALDTASRSELATAAHSHWHRVSGLAHSVQSLGNLVFAHIPLTWIYGGAACAVLLYAALFGIGAAAFRSLIATPQALRS
jgi:hypothetical protein